jgi:hypothetical protein
MVAYNRQPFDIATTLPVITDPATAHLAELAGLAYELVLHLLTRFFTHTDETPEQLGILVDSAIGVMAGALRPLASALTTLPVGPSSPGVTTGFAFEMYYAMGNLVPWREPAWALLYERASLLAERCTAAIEAHGAHEAVQKARQQATTVATELARNVPAELRARDYGLGSTDRHTHEAASKQERS